MIFDDKSPASRTDKLCALGLASILVTTTLVYEVTDGAALRSIEADKPEAGITITVPPIDFTALVEAVEARREALEEERYWSSVPLDQGCRTALREACEANDVPICLALGLIEVESGFRVDAENGVLYGLCQLNRKYWPEALTPEGNILCGISYLGELLAKYDGDEQAALRAYNRGWDDGDREYSRKVLAASEKWGNG